MSERRTIPKYTDGAPIELYRHGTRRNLFHGSNFFTTSPTWNGLAFNPVLRGERRTELCSIVRGFFYEVTNESICGDPFIRLSLCSL